MSKLGISGRGAAADRLKDAEDRGFINLLEKMSGYGRTTAHIYLISKPSTEIAEEIAAGVRSGVFPSVEMVNNTLHKPPPTPRYNGTTGTTEETIPVVPDQNCTAYTVVPEGMPPPEREFFVRKIEEIDESAQRKNDDDSEGAL